MDFLTSIQSSEIAKKVAEHGQALDPIRQFIVDHFGQTGLNVAYILAAAIVLLLAYRLIKLSFELIFFIALPSVLAAFVLSLFLPYNFFYMLPVTVAVFTLGLVMKNVAFSKG
jgi:hypothetical protein